jgi:hypothetical protein
MFRSPTLTKVDSLSVTAFKPDQRVIEVTVMSVEAVGAGEPAPLVCGTQQACAGNALVGFTSWQLRNCFS